MTPAEVRAMSAPEYVAFLAVMDEEIAQHNAEVRRAERGR